MEKRISEKRTELMGIAILCIMLCHNNITWGGEAVTTVWKAVSDLFQFGVDIFFFLSGYGLYRSWTNHPSYGAFLARRCKRILPTYLAMIGVYAVIACLVGFKTVGECVDAFSLVTFYTKGVLTEWFIAAILTTYLAFPLLFRASETDRGVKIFCGVLWGLCAVNMIFWLPFGLAGEIFFVRLPIFVLGLAAARKTAAGEKIRFFELRTPWHLLILAVCAALILVVTLLTNSLWTLRRMLFCPIALSVCALFCRYAAGEHRVLTFLGGLTLEIYLCHEKLIEIFGILFGKWIANACLAGVCANIAAALAAILVSSLFSRLLRGKKTA